MSELSGPFGGNIFRGVNEISDPMNPSELERRHVPVVRCPETVHLGEPFPVELEVGCNPPHPGDEAHRILCIELSADDTPLARIELEAGQAGPRATLWVTLAASAGEIRATSRCNRHGAWLARTPLKVVEA